MIQQTLEAVGWSQFISPAEVTTSVVALVIGWAGTEMVKRLTRHLGHWDDPRPLYPAIGFALTLAAALVTWPQSGVFPYPFIAALTLGLSAPTVYALVTYGLRKAGFGGAAGILSGNRRKKVMKVRHDRRA